MENPNPTIHEQVASEDEDTLGFVQDDDQPDPFTPHEIYNMLRQINDPEHPLTLEQLNVVSQNLIHFQTHSSRPTVLSVQFTPTIPHCSMATLIGLCIRVKLERTLPGNRFLMKVSVMPGSHQSEADINKQLNDKERVAAALENEQLLSVVNQCLYGAPKMGIAL